MAHRRAALAFLMCAVGVTAQIAAPADVSACASGDRISCTPHGGLPSGISEFASFRIASNSRVSMEFVPTCADGWVIPSLRTSSCDSLTDFNIYETDSSGFETRISVYESEPRVVCNPDIVSLILLDTSRFTMGAGGINALRNAVVAYLRELQTSLTLVRQSVAIYAFDGRAGVQAIMEFTTNIDLAISTMSSWDCDHSLYCVDPSTNFYGATVAAESILRAEVTGFTWRQQPHLIIFTDAAVDLASRVSLQGALNTLTAGRNLYNLTVYGVGLQTSSFNETRLRNLATDGVFVANVPADLEQEFRNVAQQVIIKAEEQQSTTYRIDYCSPKRHGLTTVTLELNYEGSTHRWQHQFNAGNFSCMGGACMRCASGRTYSCTDQPKYGPGAGDQQVFRCDVGDPLEHNGYCKCPCAGTYSPDQAPAPRDTVTPATPATPAPHVPATNAPETRVPLAVTGAPTATPAPPSGGGCWYVDLRQHFSVVEHLDYENNEDVCWEAECFEGGWVVFDVFSTEEGYDWLEVGGKNYSGDSLPDRRGFTNLRMRFRSDKRVKKRGFRATFVCGILA